MLDIRWQYQIKRETSSERRLGRLLAVLRVGLLKREGERAAWASLGETGTSRSELLARGFVHAQDMQKHES